MRMMDETEETRAVVCRQRSYAVPADVAADLAALRNTLALMTGQLEESRHQVVALRCQAATLREALSSLLEEWSSRTALVESCDLTEAEDAAEEKTRAALAATADTKKDPEARHE